MNDGTEHQEDPQAASPEPRRVAIAMAICALSAVVGVVAVVHTSPTQPGGRMVISSEIGVVGGTWMWTADWLGRRLGLLRMRLGDIYQRRLRDGRALKVSGIAHTMRVAGGLLLLVGILYPIIPWN